MTGARDSSSASIMNGEAVGEDVSNDKHNTNGLQNHHHPQEGNKNVGQLTNGMMPPQSHQKSETSSNRHTLNAEEVDFVFLEPFIMSGYRPTNQPWRYYFSSAFCIHNETVNVWTHALGSLCVVIHAIFLALELDGLGDPRIIPLIGTALACFLNNLLSSLAHLLHAKSPRHHFLLFFIDYAGITFYNLGNGIGSMYAWSHPHMFTAMESFYLPMVVVLCWVSFLAYVLVSLQYNVHKFALKRKVFKIIVLAVTAVFIAWPMVQRYVDCVEDAECSLSSLHHITIIFVFYAVDALSFSAHIPERWWPGRFDIWGHSHQWFHVCVIVTQQLQMHALRVDLVHLEKGSHATLDMLTMLSAFLWLALATSLTIMALGSAVDRKVAEVEREHGHCVNGIKKCN